MSDTEKPKNGIEAVMLLGGKVDELVSCVEQQQAIIARQKKEIDGLKQDLEAEEIAWKVALTEIPNDDQIHCGCCPTLRALATRQQKEIEELKAKLVVSQAMAKNNFTETVRMVDQQAVIKKLVEALRPWADKCDDSCNNQDVPCVNYHQENQLDTCNLFIAKSAIAEAEKVIK